jgi:hypothetical protein
MRKKISYLAKRKGKEGGGERTVEVLVVVSVYQLRTSRADA